jgi:hypothetical protein
MKTVSGILRVQAQTHRKTAFIQEINGYYDYYQQRYGVREAPVTQWIQTLLREQAQDLIPIFWRNPA